MDEKGVKVVKEGDTASKVLREAEEGGKMGWYHFLEKYKSLLFKNTENLIVEIKNFRKKSNDWNCLLKMKVSRKERLTKVKKFWNCILVKLSIPDILWDCKIPE